MYRVLIAEPDVVLAAIYRAALARAGFEAEVVSDGLVCVERLRAFRPHLLVLEPDLPWGRGEGVLALLHEDTDMPATTVVLVSHSEGPQLNASAARTLARYRKPLSADALVGIVRERFPQAGGICPGWCWQTAPAPAPGGQALQVPSTPREELAMPPLVLLIEDDPMNRKLLCDILEIRFTVQEAESAEQAQELLHHPRPDLIILDVQLPGKEGLAFLRGLKAAPETADIPVVIVSAHAMRGEVEAGLQNGCVEYVTKPIIEDPYDFVDRLARLVKLPS